MRDIGIKPGPQIGQILRQVFAMQLDGQVADLAGAMSAAKRIAGIDPAPADELVGR